MWDIKTVDTKMNLEAKVPGERLMMHVTAVLTNGTKDVTIPFVIENKELMDRTLLSIIERMNKTQADVETTPNGEPYTPAVPTKPEPETPTPEQVFEARRADIKSQLLQLKEDVNLGLATEIEFQAALTKAKNWLTNNKPA